jgi:Domain of unknown function (DUF1905)
MQFSGEIWYWRGPAPHHFVTVPADDAAQIASIAKAVTYGWGMVPVTAHIGQTEWTTSLFPKDGGYIVPIKAVVQQAEGLDVGDHVTITLTIA